MNTNKKILFIRLDKIGDLICTLPIDQVFSSSTQSNLTANTQVEWFISPGLKSLMDLTLPPRTVTELDKKFSFANLKKFSQKIKSFKPDAIIAIQSPWWVGLIAFLMQVPLRVAVRSRWDSFLFYNHALRQKRSQSVQHEYEYNLDLALYTYKILNPESTIDTDFFKKQIVHFNLKEKKEFADLKNKKFIVIHPGMAGSALNWPQNKYNDYIENFIKQNSDISIVITGTKSDEPYLNQIYAKWHQHPQLIWLNEKLSLIELLHVLAQAEAVIAPSTGVLHLAASLEVPTHGIYSPVKVHHPKRWGARGAHVKLYLPPPEKTDTDCMSFISLPIQLNKLKNIEPNTDKI